MEKDEFLNNVRKVVKEHEFCFGDDGCCAAEDLLKAINEYAGEGNEISINA